jgi:NAD(P)H dehydrogenase (quinone)
MQILVVFSHPARDSFVASILAELRGRLEGQGHAVRVIDLYADGFDPVLRLEPWRSHRDGVRHLGELDDHVAALTEAEGLVFVYPTWWYGLPAMLKGWLDRVFQPEVAFAIEGSEFKLHYLPKLKRFAAVTTYGSPRLFIEWIVGDPVRRQLMRGLSLQFARGVRKAWAPIYNVDGRTREDLARARTRAVDKVVRVFATH